MREVIHFKLNHKPIRLTTDGGRMLLWILRSELGLIGAKFGCGEGFCGACTVLVNKKAIRSCQLPVKDVKGKEVITIEGLAKNGKLHPLQKAFVKHDALQCGFCTPGMILSAYSLRSIRRKEMFRLSVLYVLKIWDFQLTLRERRCR